MKHFYYYPIVEYTNNQATNIMVRGKIRDALLSQSAVYYKYTVEDGERPDVIAKKYYGNSNYTWAIFYANNMFHPILDWPLDQNNFIKTLMFKYGNLQDIYRDIHHYEYTDTDTNITYIIDKQTYDLWLSDKTNPKQVRSVTVFEQEQRLNDAKRDIVVLDKEYLLQITNELSNLFK